MVRILFAVLIAASLTSIEAFAGDKHGFVETAEEIIKQLTKPHPQHAVRTRSLRIPPDSSKEIQKRAIKVISKEEEKAPVEEIVVVPVVQTAPSVNLKIEFDYDSYAIRPASFKQLDELRDALNHEALIEKKIIIKGHTDSDGGDAYNLKLSLNRALAVRNYLHGHFLINEDRLKIVGYGEALPLVPNTTLGNKQLNRRVEIQAE